MTRRTYQGRTASDGIAFGTLWRDKPAPTAPIRPANGLTAAIARAIAQLEALRANAPSLARDILEFQVELLTDDAFILELLERTTNARPEAAITAYFNEQIASFAQSRSEKFAARAADLADLRDRLIHALHGTAPQPLDCPVGVILLVDDMAPSRFLEIDWTRARGIVALAGSRASHVALLARAQAIPMIVSLGALEDVDEQNALLDATNGVLILNPDDRDSDQALAARNPSQPLAHEEGHGPALLPNGEKVRLTLCVNALADIAQVPPDWFDGIGLVRTELLFANPAALHDEATQAQAYQPLFDWAAGRPVTIRLFDAGGDKIIPGFSLEGESNAFLGVRGARLLLRKPAILATQLRAILSASQGRSTRILVPMVTLPSEMPPFRAALSTAAEATATSLAHVQLGMMVETPAAALDIARFDADFFSIGTNDLIQYTLAIARDSDALEATDALPPAVLDLIGRVVAHGDAEGRDVSLCGDAATSLIQLEQILACGVRSIAVPSRFAPRAKHFIRNET